jgi:hypothetical protein
MWIFTKYGFFSAVSGKNDDGSVIPDLMVVRARDRAHLEQLVDRFHLDANITTTPNRDYACRIVIPKSDWILVMARLAGEIEYDNFKSAVKLYQGPTPYEQVLHNVWDTVGTLQPGGPYGWGDRGRNAAAMAREQRRKTMADDFENERVPFVPLKRVRKRKRKKPKKSS